MNGSAEWDNSSQVWPKDKLTWIGVLQGQSFFIPGNLLRAKYFLSIFPGFPDVLQHSRSSNHNVCRWVYAHCETSNSIKMSTVTDLIQTYWTCVSLLCLDILGLLQLEEKKKKKRYRTCRVSGPVCFFGPDAFRTCWALWSAIHSILTHNPQQEI